MNNSIEFPGQWMGYFAYGQEYGDNIAGEKVQFRLFIDSFKDEQFVGRSVDLEGVGANFEIAVINGFLDGNFISFTKQYPHFYSFDEVGNAIEDKGKQHPTICYSGGYNRNTHTFSGQWELRVDIATVGEYWLEDVFIGTWEMKKDD